MSITSTSALSIVQLLSSQLQAQDASLSQLSTQLSTGQEYTDLTDYAPSDALNLMNLQDGMIQKQAYISVINAVQPRLSGYDTTMTDMESVVSQAQTLAEGDGNYSVANATNIGAMATNFLQSIGIDLDQQIGGRYIYAGSRYDTAPVANLTTLTSPLSPTVYTDGATPAAYDTAAAAGSVTMTTAGQNVTVGGTVAAGQSASVTVNGKTYSYTVSGTDTPTSIAASLATLVAADIPGTTSAGAVLTVGGTGTIQDASSNLTDTAAYATDSATIDAGDSVNYGVTSNNPAFQQIIAGLRYMQAAGNTTDAATYQADMTQASTLLASGLSALQTIHASVAYNINSLTTETTTQNNAITSLSNQLDNIQQVDIAQVSTEITALEAQLQASYSVTGDIERMSIVNYLPT